MSLSDLSIVGTVVTFSLYFWLLSHLPATRVATIAYLIPLMAVAIGATWMDEPLTISRSTLLLKDSRGVHPAGQRLRISSGWNVDY